MNRKPPIRPFEVAWFAAIALLGAILLYHNVQLQSGDLPPIPFISENRSNRTSEMDYFDRPDGFRCYFFVTNKSQYRCYERAN